MVHESQVRTRVSPRLCALAAVLVFAGCFEETPIEGSTQSAGEAPSQPAPQSPTTCPLVTVAVTSDVPFDTPVNDQASINCFAWQEFIALNWPAAGGGAGKPASVPANNFGKPGDYGPVVWETYMNSHQLMTENGSKPPPWGTSPDVPPACEALGGDKTRRVLNHTSKFTSDFETPDDLQEAAPNKAPNWLADRNGNPVFFEIMVSEDEYNYARSDDRRLYNSNDQASYVSAGNHIDLPRDAPPKRIVDKSGSSLGQ